jgi:hypothetical protein
VSGVTDDGQWHHFAGVYNGTTLVTYLDGVASAPVTDTASLIATAGPLKLGKSALGSYFNGELDEAGIWSRALHPSEVRQLFRRGANRIKAQVRICTTSSCSDDPNGANWKGPDGTRYSYFSEVHNSGAKTSLPSILFSAFTAPVGTSRYFQYRTILESDDPGSSCDYGAGPTWCSPELKSVSIGPGRYDASGPAVVTRNGIEMLSLSGMSETLGASCPAGVTYNLGIGGSDATALWFYHDGSAWVIANGTSAQSTTLNSLALHADAFATQAGHGKVFLRAFLRSDGATPCELDHFRVSGKRSR